MSRIIDQVNIYEPFLKEIQKVSGSRNDQNFATILCLAVFEVTILLKVVTSTYCKNNIRTILENIPELWFEYMGIYIQHTQYTQTCTLKNMFPIVTYINI